MANSFIVLISVVVVSLSYELQQSVAFGSESYWNDKISDPLLFKDKMHREILSSAFKSYDFHYHSNGTKNETVINPSIIVSSCQAFIESYANAVSSFTKCSIQYARPLRFCERCVIEYVTANSYSNIILEDVSIVDEKGNTCWQSISDSDRVQIIIRTIDFIDKLWKDCDCANCYEYDYLVNDTVKYKLNNDTLMFFAKVNQTLDCFRNVSRNSSGNHSVCEVCGEYYNDLNAFYKSLEHKYNHKTCMDIVDAMNSTRSAWSNEYHCNQKPENLMPVFVLSGFLCLLPIVFYIGNKIHGTKVQNRLLKQRRLKDSTDSTTQENVPGNSNYQASGVSRS